MLKEDVDYKALAEKVMLATDAARIMREQGASVPAVGFGSEKILGKDLRFQASLRNISARSRSPADAGVA